MSIYLVQLPAATSSDGRLLDRLFSFVVCGHPTCESLGLPCSGIYPDPIGIEVSARNMAYHHCRTNEQNWMCKSWGSVDLAERIGTCFSNITAGTGNER
jgi:hypothetical protein